MPYLQEDSQSYRPIRGFVWTQIVLAMLVCVIAGSYVPDPYRSGIVVAVMVFLFTPTVPVRRRLLMAAVFAVLGPFIDWALPNLPPGWVVYGILAGCGVMFLVAVLQERKRQRQQH